MQGRLIKMLGFDGRNDRFELPEKEPVEPFSHRTKGRSDRVAGSTAYDLLDEAILSGDIAGIEHGVNSVLNGEKNSDLVIRTFCVFGDTKSLIAYVSGMADETAINDFILRPLLKTEKSMLIKCSRRAPLRGEMLSVLSTKVLQIAEASTETELERIISAVLDGKTALFVDGCIGCIILETHGYETRAISDAENEKTVLGPKESFTENIKTNVTMIRRLIHTDSVISELIDLPCKNRLRAALIYRNGAANEALLNEIKRRLNSICPDLLIGSGMVEQLIEDKWILPIPRILSTERPDRAASHVMNGRACLLIEGSPQALIMPVDLFSLLNSPEDVYMRPPLGTLVRLVRYSGALISILLPAYFLALALYHQGGLTAEVLSTVIASRRLVFEPIAVEMILLLLVFLLIREAGLRVPGSIGQAIGIIGGLIMGQAAVAANLASSVVLIVVALSGLGNFCIADYSTQIAASYLRISLVLAAWLGGLVGIVSAVMLITALLAGAKSFGMPFLAPFSPNGFRNRPLVVRGRIENTGGAEDPAGTDRD